jgi:hypothetical protein
MGLKCGKPRDEKQNKHPTQHVVHVDRPKENVQDISVLIRALYGSDHPELFHSQKQIGQGPDQETIPIKSKNSQKVIFPNLEYNVY